MELYKKKALAFANVEDKRNLRFIRKSIDRSNVRHKRLSELRKLEESTLDEVPDEKTPIKAIAQPKVSGSTQGNSKQDKSKILSQGEPKAITYREKLEKWKEEKELKKQLEARKKIPVFKVSRVKSENPPPRVLTAATSKTKEPLKFVSKLTQPSKVALKPTAHNKDITKPSIGKMAPKSVVSVNTTSRSIPNPKESFKTIPAARNNSRQQPASNLGTKSAVLSSVRPLVKSCYPGTKTSNGTVSMTNSSTSKVLKPPASNSCVPKHIPKPVTTSAASKIPNQRTGIVPPHSYSKQEASTAKTNVSSNGCLKAPQQKHIPTSKGTKANVKKQTLCAGKDQEFEDTALMDSSHDENASKEKKRPSFAPDDFVFKAPESLQKSTFIFDTSNILAMYANMCGISLPRSLSEDKPSSKAGSKDLKNSSKVEECKPEISQTPKLSEDNDVAQKKQSTSQPELKDSEIKSDTSAGVLSEENTQRERKGQLKELPQYRQLRTISENSPLPNNLDIEDNFTGEKTYMLRRSRRLASSHFKGNTHLDPKCFQKTNPTAITTSDNLCPVRKDSIDSPLAKEFSELGLDSPSAKQYNFRVRKHEGEQRVSLLGSPVRPYTGPRKSVKGDLISFTP